MKVFYGRAVLGVFAFGEDGKVLDPEPCPRSPEAIAERLVQKASQEEDTLLARLPGGEPERRQDILVKNMGAILEAASVSREDYHRLVREVSLEIAKKALEEVPKDQLIIQAIEALDDAEEASNLLSERFLEWRGLCYPGKESAPARMAEEDREVLGDFEGQVAALGSFKGRLEDYIASLMEEVAPNLSYLIGPALGARLLSLSGGLERLSMMPSSKIQVLGAEKALFKHLKDKSPPPKHGAIFQYPAVKGGPWWQRGKIARTLANKIAMAARADAFSGKFLAPELKNQFEKRLADIKKTYPDEPKRMRIIRTRPEKGVGKKRWKKKKGGRKR
jgi:nucleolar protein 56